MRDECSLSSLERGYKQLFLSGQPISSLSDPESFERYFSEFGDVDDSFYQEHRNFALHTPIWEEDALMDKGRDISILQYPRYLPAYEHSHNYFEIYYIRRLPALQAIEPSPGCPLQAIDLTEGDVLILSPGTRHNFSILNDVGITYLIAVRKSTFATAFTPLLGQNEVLSDFFLRAVY